LNCFSISSSFNFFTYIIFGLILFIAIFFVLYPYLDLFYFSISSLVILFYLFFISYLVLIFFIAIFYYYFLDLFFNFIPHCFISFNFYIRFGPHSIDCYVCLFFFFFWMIENFASWFFWVCLLWGNPGHGFWKLVWFDFSLFFLNWFFFSFSSFNIMLLGLHLCDFSRFPFYDVNSISHPGSRVSRANPSWVVFFFISFVFIFFIQFLSYGVIPTTQPNRKSDMLTQVRFFILF
jgi:hypothetical protein